MIILDKVFRKLRFQLEKEDMEEIVQCKQGAIEQCLLKLQHKVKKQDLI